MATKITKSELKEMIREALREELTKTTLKESAVQADGEIIALITRYPGKNYSAWAGFALSAEDTATINAVLENYVNEGGSTYGSASDVLKDLASYL